MRKYRDYTDKDVIDAAKGTKSIAGLLRKLGLKASGGNYINIKRIIQKLKINTSHWTGQGWNNGQQLKDWSKYTKAIHLKKHLIREKGHRCETCKLTEWQNQKIILEVHHKDGDRTNNKLNNLNLLCCNCHAVTGNWRNRSVNK